jgi:hypothetical protein
MLEILKFELRDWLVRVYEHTNTRMQIKLLFPLIQPYTFQQRETSHVPRDVGYVVVTHTSRALGHSLCETGLTNLNVANFKLVSRPDFIGRISEMNMNSLL